MEDQSTRTAFIFSLNEEIGGLVKALHVFEVRYLNSKQSFLL